MILDQFAHAAAPGKELDGEQREVSVELSQL